MIIKLSDWTLDVDIALTMALSNGQAEDHCQCAYCRNYYAGVDRVYPALRPFLAKFGVHVEGPDELCPFEPTIYEATYIIQGQILHRGSEPLHLDELPIRLKTSGEADLETEHPEPYFAVCVGLMELPWLLPERMEDVISPANEPEFLARMERKLLERASETGVYS